MSKNRILFSAVGDTDPVRNYYDGAMLHIIRYYNPQKVYMYLSKEMMGHEDNNQLYTRAVKVVKKDIDIELYPKNREELVENAYDFDKFYDAFYNIIETIKKENKDSEILLNLSSGTPAMKSTMFMLGIALNDENIKLIQVTSPEKKSNKDVEHVNVKEVDVEELILCSYDTEKFGEKGMNRCIEQSLNETKKVFILHNVREMLAKSDYSGLNNLVEKYKSILSKDTYNYVKHVYNRYIGNYELAKKYAKELKNEDLYPVKNVDTLRIVEKFNIIKIKSKREEVQDWIVLIYNIIEKLYLQILIKNNIDINLFVDEEDRINVAKFKEKYNKYYKLFTTEELTGRFNYWSSLKIIENIDANLKDALEKDFKKMRIYRNKVAHNLEFLTKEEIESNTGNTLKEFENKVKKYIYDFKVDTTTENLTKALSLYENMDKKILECFENEIKVIDR